MTLPDRDRAPFSSGDLEPFLNVDESILRRSKGAKWTRYGPDVLPAWVADMDFPIAANIASAMRDAIDRSDLGYPSEDDGLARSCAEWASARWNWSPDPSMVTVMPDVVRSIDRCIEVLTEPGDAILVTTPIYPPFLKRIAALQRSVMEVPLTEDGYRLDWSALRHARPAMVLLCSPHNPSGRVLTVAELEMVAGLGVPIVSDEIHADLVYSDSPAHRPTASLDAEVAARTITLTSASKAFNLAGLRCALMIAGSSEMHARLHLEHEPVGALGIVATRAAWTPAGASWLERCMHVLARNRATVGAWAVEHGVGFVPPEATYLAWLDFSALEVPDDAAEWILQRGKVALSPGLDFGRPGTRHARLNFATSPALLEEILDRVAKAL